MAPSLHNSNEHNPDSSSTTAQSKPITNGSHPKTITAGTTAAAPTQPNPPLSTFTPNPALHVSPSHALSLAPSPPLHPGPNDCVLHMHTNGICGSDQHLWHAGRIGDLRVSHPHCLGHEGAGVIVWAGSDVSHLKLGDRVAVEPGVPCHRHDCTHCGTGEYNLCEAVRFSGVPPYAGSIRRYHVHDARYLHRLPDGLSMGEGALLEPLSVVLHALERSPVRLGEPVLVSGAGPIGLVCAAACRASGAWPVVVADVDEGRLEFAADWLEGVGTVLVEDGMGPEDVAERAWERFAAVGAPKPRVSFECTGVGASVSACLRATRRGGEVMVIGVGKSVMDGLPFMHASMGEIDLKFINRYHHSWPYAIRLMQSGYINLKPLVTHRFKLEDAVQAMHTVADNSQRSIKVHIVDGEEDETLVANGHR